MPGLLMVLSPSRSQRRLLGAVVVGHLWILSCWRHKEAAPHGVAVTLASARRDRDQGLES